MAPPWTSGPGEILRHSLELLREDSDTNRRLAMILIDNAVELTVKTYLGLPKRVTGLQIGRKELAEISESFPALLDALERHGSKLIAGIDLGEIEWYHRLRNELYHQGNGLTVERDKVDVYAQLANALFKNLFGVALVEPVGKSDRTLGEFLSLWTELERGILSLAHDHSLTGAHGMPLPQATRLLEGTGIFSEDELDDLRTLQQLRNKVVHGSVDHRIALTPGILARVRALRDKFGETE
jgi:hypothetical protein